MVKQVVLGGLLLLAGGAEAMHIGYSTSVVGFSADGSAVLLSVSGHGPEGGGTTSLRLLESGGHQCEMLGGTAPNTGECTHAWMVLLAVVAKVERLLAAAVSLFDVVIAVILLRVMPVAFLPHREALRICSDVRRRGWSWSRRAREGRTAKVRPVPRLNAIFGARVVLREPLLGAHRERLAGGQ